MDDSPYDRRPGSLTTLAARTAATCSVRFHSDGRPVATSPELRFRTKPKLAPGTSEFVRARQRRECGYTTD